MTGDIYYCNYGAVIIKQTRKTYFDAHYVVPEKTADSTHLICNINMF